MAETDNVIALFAETSASPPGHVTVYFDRHVLTLKSVRRHPEDPGLLSCTVADGDAAVIRSSAISAVVQHSARRMV